MQQAADCGVTGVVVEIPSSLHIIEFAYQWELVGQPPAEAVLGKGSGRDSVLYFLSEVGYTLRPDDPRVDEVLVRVKESSLAKKGLLTREDFAAIAQAVLGAPQPVRGS